MRRFIIPIQDEVLREEWEAVELCEGALLLYYYEDAVSWLTNYGK